MDIVKKIKQLQQIHDFILLEQEPNTIGDYIFFYKCDFDEILNYYFKIFIIRNDLRIDTLTEIQTILNKLLNYESEYFKIINIKPISLGDFFITYEITISIGEFFDIELDNKGKIWI